MTTALTIIENQPLVPRQADTDDQLIELWLHGRSEHTERAYRADAKRFLSFVGNPLNRATLADLQAFADAPELTGTQPATKHRRLSAVKSLFAFAHRLGYLPFDVARPLRLPGFRDTLTERILDETEVHRILALEGHPRNSVILVLLYAAGIRVSEACGLKWRDCQARSDGGQISVFGKGQKTRTVLLPVNVWQRLMALRETTPDDMPVFRSRRGGHLHPCQMLRIVKAAAKKAGNEKRVSPHWFRHAHASHALDRGAPISLVQATLGHSSVATTGRYLHARPSDGSARFLPL